MPNISDFQPNYKPHTDWFLRAGNNCYYSKVCSGVTSIQSQLFEKVAQVFVNQSNDLHCTRVILCQVWEKLSKRVQSPLVLFGW